jgi:RNase P subunit RPR2
MKVSLKDLSLGLLHATWFKVVGLEVKLCSLEDILREVERVKEEEVEKARKMEPKRKLTKSTYLVYLYCPKCLIRVYSYTNNELRTGAKKGVVPECSYCKVELRVVDDEFKKRYMELWESYRRKVEMILRPIWKVLRNWWIETDVNTMPCIVDRYSVTVKFDAPSHLKIYIEDGEVKAYMYLHWFEPERVHKFEEIVKALKNAKVKALVEVDPRWDHCRVRREDMERLGFRMGLLDWQLEIQP